MYLKIPGTLTHQAILHYEHFWFQKRPHLNISERCKKFSSFSPKLLLYLMIFPNSAVHLALSTLEDHQIWQKIWGK